MTHIRFRALAAAMVLAGTAAINSAFAAGDPSIAIDNFTFAPAEVTVKAGTKVLFVNHDDIPHLVVLVIWKDDARAYAAVSYLAPTERDAFVAAFRKAAAKERGQTGEVEGGR